MRVNMDPNRFFQRPLGLPDFAVGNRLMVAGLSNWLNFHDQHAQSGWLL